VDALDVAEAFATLSGLSRVRPAERGLALHDDVRAILAQDLAWRKPQRYRELGLRRFAYHQERGRTAPAEEREWLVAERLYLWGHVVGEPFVFSEDEASSVWVVPGAPPDPEEVLAVFGLWLQGSRAAELGPLDDARLGAELAFERALLERADVEIQVARDEAGRALGLSTVVPVTQATYDLLAPHPTYGPVLRRFVAMDASRSLPAEVSAATVCYNLHLAHLELRGDVVRAALVRRWLGSFAGEGAYLIATPLPSWRPALEALRFRPLPADGGAEDPDLGYVLDLRGVGVEGWIGAVLGDRPLARALTAPEVEVELAALLAHWHDPARLGASPLAGAFSASSDDAPAQRAHQLRQGILAALARARGEASEEQRLALDALELAYLGPYTSAERGAARLSVSRSTFYRLLRRATHHLARALVEP
jgi:hypothetical protein